MFVKADSFKVRKQKDNSVIITEKNDDGVLECLEYLLGGMEYIYHHNGSKSSITISCDNYKKIKKYIKNGFNY